MQKDRVDIEIKAAMRRSEIQEKLEWLKSDDPQHRKVAVQRLGELQAAPESILPLLGDTDVIIRADAATALGKCNNVVSGNLRAEIISHLIGMLNDPGNRVVSSAVWSLGMLNAKEATPEIRGLLNEKGHNVVHASIVALARLDDHASIEPIMAFLESHSDNLKQAAWHALGVLNHTPIIPLLLKNLQTSLEQHPLSPAAFALVREYIDICKRMKIKLSAPLLVQVALNEIGLRTKAADALLDLDIANFPVELLELLNDPNAELRAAILGLIYQTHYPIPHLRVRKFLHDEASNVRLQALDLVAIGQDSEAIPTVRFLCYRDTKTYVRAKSIVSLVKLIGLNALPDLHALAFDEKFAVRAAVVSSLGSLGPDLPDRAISILEHLHNNEETRDIADTILQTLTDPKTSLKPLDPPKSWLPFPDNWAVGQPEYLIACTQWLNAIGQAEFDSEHIEEALAAQTALSTLITLLSREGK